MKLLTIALLLISTNSFADDKTISQSKYEVVNYCADAEIYKNQEKILQGLMIKYNYDVDTIRLYGLFVGLCKAVADKKVKLEDAINVFKAEHLKIATEWANEARKNGMKKDKTI